MKSVTDPTPETPQPAPEVKRLHCACCEYTQLAPTPDASSFYEEAGYLLAQEEDKAYRVCGFCKLLFPALVPAVPDLSDIELMGAWADFVEDVRQFDLNVGGDLRRSSHRANQQMPQALTEWAKGSVFTEEGPKFEVLSALWPREAYSRVLKLMEAAVVVTDELDHCYNIGEIKAAVADCGMAPVWQSWLGRTYLYGKMLRDGQTNWFRQGGHHIENCLEFAGVVAKHQARKQMQGKA